MSATNTPSGCGFVDRPRGRPGAALAVLLAALAVSCAEPSPRLGPAPSAPAVEAITSPGPAVSPSAAANFELTVAEVVENPEQDGVSYTKVFVGGELAGQTPTGPRSREKGWEGALPPGNHLFRFELWVLPGLGGWARLPDERQPRERFLRIEGGMRTKAALRFYDKGGKNELRVSRQPL